MSKYKLFIFIITSILLLSCNKKKRQREQTLSGSYVKIWVFRDKEDNSINGYNGYYVFFKSGKAKYILRNAVFGISDSYFSPGLARDVVNLDNEWYVKADSLSIMGSKFQIKNISSSKDTILLEGGALHYQYYLINSNLLVPVSTKESIK